MIKIKEVTTSIDLDLFISFPWKIYKNDNLWVPPIIDEVKKLLSRENPFWEHADKKLFLLYEGDIIVGRIAGIIDYNYINFQNEQAGFFGFFEVFDNEEYASCLIKAVESWLLSKDIKVIYGPMNPSTNDEMGFFLEGENSSPMLMMPYNPFYYITLMESLNYQKAKDLYAYILNYDDFNMVKLVALKEKLKKRFLASNVKVRCINMKNLKAEVNFALDVYNHAWEKNWGFVPWTEKEFFSIAEMLKTLADPRLILFLEVENKPAGMMVVVPDYNQVIKKINGRLNVLGLLKFFFYKRKIDQARLMILGVKKEFRKQGLETLLYLTAAENVKNTNFKKLEFSWILEDNILTCRAAEMSGAKLYKKYRVFTRNIGDL